MQKEHFKFGKNWKRFLKYINDQRIETAKSSLIDFLGLDNFKGRSFLDVGCGSCLFSYAAFLLGAEQIFSFDIDKFCLECCGYFYKMSGKPSNWYIHKGSVLDKDFFQQLEKFDIVYSWGVLHHTGNLWQALRNCASLVKEDGLLHIAIYNKKEGTCGSIFWLKIKRIYNKAPLFIKYLMEVIFVTGFISASLSQFKNPFKKIINHREKRGMAFFIDVRDWLGGLPYEFASYQEVVDFLRSDFDLLKVRQTERGLGNNEYLFRKKKTK